MKQAWARFVKFFIRTEYRVVELEKELPLQGDPQDHILAVKQLEHNPGFQYLIRKFHLQRAALRAHLLQDQHRNMLQIVRLQEGIRWSGWLEDQLTRALAWKPPQRENPQAELLEEFNRTHRALFGVEPKP